MPIRYSLSSQAEQQLFETLTSWVANHPGARICEVGGGANPALAPDLVRQFELDYTVVDVSEAELAKAPAAYHKICADITREGHDVKGPFDLVFSLWRAEHVPDGQAFHRAIYKLLADGGHAVHLFPTLYSPPFVLNRLIPEGLSERLLLWLQPHRESDGDHGKFPARYSWCRGPSRGQLARFESLGYQIQQYEGYFGHSGNVAYGAGYLNRIPMLCRLHETMSRWLTRHPHPHLTTLAVVVLRKGDAVVPIGNGARGIVLDHPMTAVSSLAPSN